VSVQVESTRHKNRSSGLRMAIAFLIGAALACGVLAASLTQSASNQSPTSTIGPGWTCNPGPRSSCTLAAAGTNLSMGPVSSWCVVNSSNSGTSWTCDPSPLVFSFNETVTARLSGIFSVGGPFELFLVPAAQGCIFEGSLEDAYQHVDMSCAIPVYWPPYSPLNLTPQISNPVDLSNFSYAFGHLSPGIPPAFWSLIVVDTGNASETVHIDSSLAVTSD
jgi:hypothetical protein